MVKVMSQLAWIPVRNNNYMHENIKKLDCSPVRSYTVF